jgi:cytochrome b
VRLLHWLLAGLVLFDYFIDDEGGFLHRTIGYVAVGVVFSRLLWSASPRARTAFAPCAFARPRATLSWLRGGAPRSTEHDPLGLWMVWLLWSLVLLLGLTGWMTRPRRLLGRRDPAGRALPGWPMRSSSRSRCTVAGVAAMSWRWRENLLLAMLTGKKRGP